MAANKILNVGPAYVANGAANLLTPGAAPGSAVGYTSTAPYIIVKHIRIMNKDSSAHVVTLFKGATGASAGGTEVCFDHFSLAAASFQDWYGNLRLDTADFLVGTTDATSQVTINIDGEIGLS